MPHKRNPILTERMIGMASLLRGYAAIMQENIKTLWERDIAHSSVERVVLPDATSIAVYMLRKMTWIISNLVVNRDRMAQGIDRMGGTWASERVKLLLHNKGVVPNLVYNFVQTTAFQAIDSDRLFRECLWLSPLLLKTASGSELKFSELVTEAELNECFEFKSTLEERLPRAYARMNLDEALALPPNV